MLGRAAGMFAVTNIGVYVPVFAVSGATDMAVFLVGVAGGALPGGSSPPAR
ncbi:hypothetical protein [Amycolatopsis magusensis]|uniref:Cadmium resistance protein CadD (Predicted permease) n=1 Tax=Amycolatopsis magusensis TaxID=882444 RepID=A0ABS4PY73_9PSEU|nr:hypothetical protein [Amycolatopsis magusensis]MBP2184386.1 cadmium resistance protein CadD (predicted permease) [Amycolatopsis magusensis]